MPRKHALQIEPLYMTNGMTSVFIDLLVLSGSALAATNREKELIIWLAQRDQSVVGIGTVGFDLDEMPWTIDNFEEEKSFLLRLIDSGLSGLGWERLSYEPRKDWVVDRLTYFKRMIEGFDQEHVDIKQYLKWSEIDELDDNSTIPVGYPMCETHKVFLSCHGCVLCNFK